jgi:hypothetical protein
VPTAQGKGGVLALQTGSPPYTTQLPFFTDAGVVAVNSRDPTRDIVAGEMLAS